eukprot:COSAG02_NODE_33310_length_502_cov_0.843672_1_plen_57_part_10
MPLLCTHTPQATFYTAWMERHLQLQREVTDERRAAGDEHFVCPGMVVGQAVLTDTSP